MFVVVLLTQATTLILLAYCLAKLRRMSGQLYDIGSTVTRIDRFELLSITRQLELRELLRFELQLERPLPPTRGWAASPDFLLHIARHALEARPERIVECGSGTSTIVLARCCQLSGRGHVYSLDDDGAFAEQTRQELARHGLAAFATILHAPLAPCRINGRDCTWYQLDKLPSLTEIDMVVVDGPPMPSGRLIRYPAGAHLIRHLSAGGKAFLDDALRPDEREAVALWLSEIPGLSKRDLHAEKGCVELSRRHGGDKVQG